MEVPAAIARVVHEWGDLTFPTETQADCGACPLARPVGGAPTSQRPFLAKVRCCTYYPVMANFLAGEALLQGGVSSERMLRRILMGDGLERLAVLPNEAWIKAYDETKHQSFGRDASLRCPYWVEGPLGCSVWHARSSVCRTWFCRHEDGPRGWEVWRTVRQVISLTERLVARHLADQTEEAPATPREWVRFYIWCAYRARELKPQEIAAIRTPELLEVIQEMQTALVGYGAPIPEVLGANLTKVELTADDQLWVTGSSTLQGLELPKTLFAFLSKLDGRPWREALEGCEDFTVDDVERMYRAGLLGPYQEWDGSQGAVSIDIRPGD